MIEIGIAALMMTLLWGLSRLYVCLNCKMFSDRQDNQTRDGARTKLIITDWMMKFVVIDLPLVALLMLFRSKVAVTFILVACIVRLLQVILKSVSGLSRAVSDVIRRDILLDTIYAACVYVPEILLIRTSPGFQICDHELKAHPHKVDLVILILVVALSNLVFYDFNRRIKNTQLKIKEMKGQLESIKAKTKGL